MLKPWRADARSSIHIYTPRRYNSILCCTTLDPYSQDLSDLKQVPELKSLLSKGKNNATARCLVALLIAAPVLYQVWVIYQFGTDLPYWDQWDYLPFFEKWHAGTLSFADLFAQFNEYRQFFPNLIFLALGVISDWDVRLEMLVSMVIACAISAVIFKLGQKSSKPDQGSKGMLLIAPLLAHLLVFSPTQYDNWLFGTQIIYFIPALCVVGGLLLSQLDSLPLVVRELGCVALAVVATFSAANGILSWAVFLPPLLYIAFTGRSLRRSFGTCTLFALCAAGSLLLYTGGYHKPTSSPSPFQAFQTPGKAVVYFLALLGRPLDLTSLLSEQAVPTIDSEIQLRVAFSAAVGGIALLLYLLSIWLLCVKVRRELQSAEPETSSNRSELGKKALYHQRLSKLCWMSLGAYSILTAALVTVGRLGFGVRQALTPRYTTYTLYLYVALIFLLPSAVKVVATLSNRNRQALLTALASVLFAAQLCFTLLSLPRIRLFQQELLRGRDCIQLINQLPIEAATKECLEKYAYPNYELLKQRVNSLNALGYLRPPLAGSNQAQTASAP